MQHSIVKVRHGHACWLPPPLVVVSPCPTRCALVQIGATLRKLVATSYQRGVTSHFGAVTSCFGSETSHKRVRPLSTVAGYYATWCDLITQGTSHVRLTPQLSYHHRTQMVSGSPEGTVDSVSYFRTFK